MQQHRMAILHAYPNDYLVESLCRAGAAVVVFGHGSHLSETPNLEAIVSVALWDRPGTLCAIGIYHKEKPFDAILPVNEGTVSLAAEACELLAIPGVLRVTADASRNKYLSFLVWREQGIPSPETIPIHGSESEWATMRARIGEKAILKLADSMNSQGVMLVQGEEQFYLGLSKLKKLVDQDIGVSSDIDRNRFAYGNGSVKFLAQRFCPGKEFGIDVFLRRDGSDRVLVILEKEPAVGPYFAETASMWPPMLSSAQEGEIGAMAIRAVRALGLREGPAHVEIRYSDGEPMVIEAGLRTGGGYTARLIERLSGQNVYEMQARLALGQELDSPRIAGGRAICFGGVTYSGSGRIIRLEGLEVFENLPELEEVVFLNSVGDIVAGPPETAQPHFCYYLLSGESRSRLLEVHRVIQEAVVVRLGKARGA